MMDQISNGGDNVTDKTLYIETPTIHSTPLSICAGFPVYLKLENLQIPGSFKIRGISNYCQKAVARGCKRIVCASGGNAGLAAAYSARQLNIPATIVLPTTTPDFVADKLREQGATVEVHGGVWNESNQYALELASSPESVYVPPFDHPDIWEGHASMIKESANQMPQRPDVIIVSVGGGGLLNGILQGMSNVGWETVPVVAMETEGADCLNASIKAGKIITLPAITSIAKCLGALSPAPMTYEYSKKYNVISHLCTDKQAVDACLRYADDHRHLVEPACGASLAAVYSGILGDLRKQGKLGDITCALVIVCGGSCVSLDALQKWKQDFNL